MNSLIQTNQQTIIDFNSIKPKIKQTNKTYNFFIYYMHDTITSEAHTTNLQKITFKLKEEKAGDKTEMGKNIFLFFTDLDNEYEVDQSLFDIKTQMLENHKSKIILYGYESHLLQLLGRANLHGLDMSNIPIAIYSMGLYNDLARCLGWGDDVLGDLTLKAASQFEHSVKKWITSPTEKIDVWEVEVSVDSKMGNIFKLTDDGASYILLPEKILFDRFISHFSVGYHPKLTSNYESHRKPHSSVMMNKFIYSIESMKKFCCVGISKVNNATGVVNIGWKDQKGHDIQIMKHFRQQAEEEMGQKRVPQKKILTVLLSNIDRFHGQKLKFAMNNFKMNDGKIELFVFQSLKECSLLSSIAGQIRLNFCSSDEETYIQINNSCYKLHHPLEVKIKLANKIKVLINKDILEC